MISDEYILEYAKEYYEYKDGKFFWKKKSSSNTKVGTEVGYWRPDGYRCLQVKKRKLRTHRVIFYLFHGFMPKFVDHIDGDRSNNKIENLREVTQSQNSFNARLCYKSRSGIKGVTWHKGAGKWQAHVVANKVNYYLGLFTCLNEAKELTDFVREELHGEFANFGTHKSGKVYV